jgi:hypothetical protein
MPDEALIGIHRVTAPQTPPLIHKYCFLYSQSAYSTQFAAIVTALGDGLPPPAKSEIIRFIHSIK